MISFRNIGTASAAGAHAGFVGAGAAIAIRGQERRFLGSLVPAAAITISLFLAMTALIRTDDVRLDEKEARPLFAITPQHKPAEVIVRDRFPPPLEVLDLPPLPPVQKAHTTGTAWPVIDLTPDAWELPLEAVGFVPPKAHAIDARIATPVRPPVASYPTDMARRGISGKCDVRFSLSTRGLPYDITASCTHPGFVKEAVRAVGRTEFLPKIQDGVPVESHNYVYPLEFELQ